MDTTALYGAASGGLDDVALLEALNNQLECLQETYLPRDLKQKFHALERELTSQLQAWKSALTQRQRLRCRMKALQLTIAGQEALNARPGVLCPQRSLRQAGIVSNVYIDLNLIPDPQEWDQVWVERLQDLRGCDLTLLHSQVSAD